MKRLVPAALTGLCILLLACSQAALESASEALVLWWSRVLPALFPFYVLTTLLNRCGLLARLQTWFRSAFAPCFLLGAIAGYPTGARVSRLLGSERLAACCNLCSPMFLLGVVATGMCGNSAFFFPLAVAHYGSALLLFAAQRGLGLPRGAPDAVNVPPARVQEGDLISDIASGVQAMLNIGGCMVFFYVPVNALLSTALGGRFPLLSAVLVGLTELTSGCRRAVALGLPTNVLCGLLAFFVSFGGLCVFAQAMLVAQLKHPLAYLLQKAAQGCLAAVIAYLSAPLFLGTSVTALSSSAEAYAQNALIGAVFLASACVGLVGCYLLALIARRPTRGQDAAQTG